MSTGDTIKGATTPVGYQTGGPVRALSSATCWMARLATTPSPATARRCLTTSSLRAVPTRSIWPLATAVRITWRSTLATETLTLVVLTLLAPWEPQSLRPWRGAEFVNPGYWGVAAGGSSTNINVLFPANGAGTSAGQLDGQWLQPSGRTSLTSLSSAWGTGAKVNGLTADTRCVAHPRGRWSGFRQRYSCKRGAGCPRRYIAGTAGAPTDLIMLSQGSFLNAQRGRHELSAGGYNYDPLG